MTQLQALAVLAIRVLAIWLLVTVTSRSAQLAASMLLPTPFEFGGSASRAMIFSIVAMSATAALLPILFLFYARRLARWAVPDDAPEIPGLNIEVDAVARLAMSIIGLLLLANALPHVAGSLVRLAVEYVQSLVAPAPFAISGWWSPGLPEYLTKSILGAALFAAAFRVSPFIRPIRRLGTGAKLDEPPTSPSQSKERS